MHTETSERAIGIGKIIALLSLYITWGGTYLAMRISLESFPPFLLAGIRHTVAGSILFLFLKVKGAAVPNRSEWKGAAIVGGFLLLGGNGGVVFAQQWVSSGLAALGVATVPLWTVLFGGIWKRWPTRLEWTGLLVGFAGIALLNLEGDLRASPVGATALFLAAMSWAFGSAWSRHLTLPSGLMAAAAEMMAGGMMLLMLSLLTGEKMAGTPTPHANWALAYLIVFGSIVGFSAYIYLLKNASAAVATSYAYVNPVIAVVLGVWLAGETITGTGVLAMMAIIAAVAWVLLGQQFKRKKR